ncbi:hypothetical protein ANN_14876 [Periplaneta americana]|uniref:Uncharacterized protein n=1 Tax=Periplaneta americana TaxID=6978 RepID=A0ABQ8SZ13_PERAM|nr:hypothetical protein ANN_14876 [Periplaneta americana]
MAGLCEGGNEPQSSLKATKLSVTLRFTTDVAMKNEQPRAPESKGEANTQKKVAIDKSGNGYFDVLPVQRS